MGLQAEVELEKSLVAGPWHPAFGELVNSRLMLQKTRKLLAGARPNKKYVMSISDKDQSVFRGMKSKNILRLQALGLSDRFTLKAEPDQMRNTVILTPYT